LEEWIADGIASEAAGFDAAEWVMIGLSGDLAQHLLMELPS
jgi:hypothetical protein